ncbi:alpha-ketoglutarate-dependent dioxygenase AlkB [Bacterioplanes sanyensis]|uniref:alpha-ketoglutarate-dependent dioxygenase AlkB family protein n=1 Tax=Bacterioplanes sanyensis TaxID=1249553 RepID=UPI00199100B9|nr:alpha-ketoglutarate-dependent dioxygenase AlkB [Bacterioplanes sanyensis]GGY33140.1 alpha-ketoglutarate-dependent dioxygenase AlkB [Bacterioplanes sanyensis]
MLTDPVTLLDGLLEYHPQAIGAADALFEQLQDELPWQQDQIQVYGRWHPIPRLQSWHGDNNAHYRYSGHLMAPKPWTPALQQLRAQLSAFGLHHCNSVLCNLYRNGQDSMGWHSDDEPELDPDQPIVSISLGTTRDFCLRPRGSRRQHSKIALAHGSVLVMHPGMQQQWQHALPKRAGIASARINLTFRHILTTTAH